MALADTWRILGKAFDNCSQMLMTSSELDAQVTTTGDENVCRADTLIRQNSRIRVRANHSASDATDARDDSEYFY